MWLCTTRAGLLLRCRVLPVPARHKVGAAPGTTVPDGPPRLLHPRVLEGDEARRPRPVRRAQEPTRTKARGSSAKADHPRLWQSRRLTMRDAHMAWNSALVRRRRRAQILSLLQHGRWPETVKQCRSQGKSVNQSPLKSVLLTQTVNQWRMTKTLTEVGRSLRTRSLTRPMDGGSA